MCNTDTSTPTRVLSLHQPNSVLPIAITVSKSQESQIGPFPSSAVFPNTFRVRIGKFLKPYFFEFSNIYEPNFFLSPSSKSQMDARKPKQKKAANVHDPDTPDSLVSALAGELLAPENLNLLLPVAMFTVRALVCEFSDNVGCSDVSSK